MNRCPIVRVLSDTRIGHSQSRSLHPSAKLGEFTESQGADTSSEDLNIGDSHQSPGQASTGTSAGSPTARGDLGRDHCLPFGCRQSTSPTNKSCTEPEQRVRSDWIPRPGVESFSKRPAAVKAARPSPSSVTDRSKIGDLIRSSRGVFVQTVEASSTPLSPISLHALIRHLTRFVPCSSHGETAQHHRARSGLLDLERWFHAG